MRSLISVLVVTISLPVAAQMVTPAFTYQGRLTESGAPASGDYDLEFRIFNDAVAGAQIGPTLSVDDLHITDGLFSMVLDFGLGVFDGDRRWLEVAVRDGASTGAFTVLTPRQELTATPHASVAAETPWSGLTGVPAGFADGVDHDSLGALLCATNEIARWNGSAWECSEDQPAAGVPHACQWRVVRETDEISFTVLCADVGPDFFAITGACWTADSTSKEPVQCFPVKDGVRYGNGAMGAANYPEAERAEGWYGRWSESGSHEVAVLCCRW